MIAKSDIDIAKAAIILPVREIGAKAGIPAEALIPFGHDKVELSVSSGNHT